MNISSETVSQMRDSLSALRDEVSAFVNGEGILPSAHSRAVSDRQEFLHPESVQTSLGQAAMLIEVTSDQLTAFLKTITDPVETIAPWTCVRSLLESAAICAWLLDPTIAVRQRVGRSLALRFEGLEQQTKYVRASGHDPAPVLAQLDDLEHHAVRLGYQTKRDEKGKLKWVGQPMPSATELTGGMLSAEPMYRLLSAVAHGHFWAIHQLSFRQVDDPPELAVPGVGLVPIVKSANLLGYAYLIIQTAQVFSRPIWYQCVYCGWDQDRLARILDECFDRLQMHSSTRFWHHRSGFVA